MSHFRKFSNCIIGYSIWSDLDLILTPAQIEAQSDGELLSLCRWFAQYYKDMTAIEKAREHGYEYPYDAIELQTIAETTKNNTIRREAIAVITEQNNLMRKRTFRTVPSEQPKRSSEGYVYLLQADNGTYKIGRTKSPNSRFKQLGILLPYQLETICLIHTQNMSILENQLHARFAKKHVNGEWFKLDKEDIEYIKSLKKEQDEQQVNSQ